MAAIASQASPSTDTRWVIYATPQTILETLR
jgi:hypothetical protein